VERGVVEDDFAFFTGLEFLRALTFADDGENLAAVRASLAVALEVGFGELLICGVGSLFGCAFPRSAGANLLFSAGLFESFEVEMNADIACGVRHEIERQAVGLVKVEGILAGEYYVRSILVELKYFLS